jgi:rhodanese-related sulfurtransferase
MKTPIKYISLNKAIHSQKKGKGMIIDIREPAEYRDGYLPGAINLPSSQANSMPFKAWDDQELYLICQSGNRAKTLASKLAAQGLTNVFVLKKHMEYITTEKPHIGWSVDRQFRFTLGNTYGHFSTWF